ncbi:magnesium transporter [Patescibacteria group bacterium]|nr:magnesium transporter [Patescibacteria group bacterium]
MNKSLNKAQEVLLRLIRRRAFNPAFNAMQKMQPADLAILFNYLPEIEKKWFTKSILKNKKLALIISELEEENLSKFLSLITEQELINILEDMNPDDAVDLLSLLEETKQQELLEKLTKPQKMAVSKLLGFASDTAGGIMTTDFLALSEDMTSQEAIDFLKKLEKKPEILYVYIIDDHQKLVGVVSFKELVMAQKDQKLLTIMHRDPISVSADKNQEEASSMIAKYNLLALPVIDEHHRLIGQITVDDAIDVLYEEATEDIYRLANLGKEEHISTSILTSTKLRSPWLLINLATTLLAAYTISLFEETIAEYIVLAVLLPVVAGMGGNAGTQSLTIVVRSLALGEIDWRIGLKVVFKEIRVGLLNGIITGLVMGLIAFLWYDNLILGLILFLAMIGNLIIAGLFGASVPLILRKLNLDPALGSSIFVTTATDIGGFILFLGLATLLIKVLI